MKKRAKNYFILADQYLETSKLLLRTLIENGNSNCGTGASEIEAYEKMRENALKSDSTLLIPTIFNSYQSIELLLKGILLLNNKDIEGTHEVKDMLEELKKIYSEEADVYKKIKDFYFAQIEIISKFKKTNNLTSTKQLYEALRYPENNASRIENKKFYNYFDLIYNGDFGKKNFEELSTKLQEVKEVILKEYHTKY